MRSSADDPLPPAAGPEGGESHLSALRIGGAVRKEKRDEAAPGKRRWLSKLEERMASAGGKDWREGERTTVTRAAVKNPETLMSHSIFPRRRPFLRILGSKKLANRKKAERSRKASDPFGSASLERRATGSPVAVVAGKAGAKVAADDQKPSLDRLPPKRRPTEKGSPRKRVHEPMRL